MPDLPKKGRLRREHRWQSLLWMINTAESHGRSGLIGLTVALTRMIQADAFATLFYDARPHRSPLGRIDSLLWGRDKLVVENSRRDDLLTSLSDARTFELSTTAVIAAFWEPWRLARAMQNVGRDDAWGSWQQDSNHYAVAWDPWPLVWISNGNHSATAALLKGGGAITCEEHLDASPLLRVVRTDGHRWYGEFDRDLGPVRSLPMAGIIEIGRRLVHPFEP